MDPNVNLREQRELAEQIACAAHNDAPAADVADMGERLADLVQALDAWLRLAGTLPDAWYDAWYGPARQ